jgi:hypothetical protein
MWKKVNYAEVGITDHPKVVHVSLNRIFSGEKEKI